MLSESTTFVNSQVLRYYWVLKNWQPWIKLRILNAVHTPSSHRRINLLERFVSVFLTEIFTFEWTFIPHMTIYLSGYSFFLTFTSTNNLSSPTHKICLIKIGSRRENFRNKYQQVEKKRHRFTPQNLPATSYFKNFTRIRWG